MSVARYTVICVNLLVAASCAFVTSSADAQSSKPAARPKATACHLLTNAEVAALLGRAVVSSKDMAFGADMANCTYYGDAAGAIPVASIQLNLKGGLNFYKAACESMPNALGTKRPAVSGLGDQACVDTTAAGSGFFVRKGDKLATLSAGVVVGKANYDQSLALAKAVAAKL